ncbi:MAG: fimbrial usher protein StbD [Pseudomonas sp.]
MKALLFLLTCAFSVPALAQSCIRVESTSLLSTAAISAGYTATSWTGSHDTYDGATGLPHTITLSNSSSFQPSGTLLASTTVNFLTGATSKAYSANQVLFRCDASLEGTLYEYYSTNGDNAYTGQWAASEVDGAYYTWVRNVASRLTNNTTGEYYSRYWKRRTLESSDLYNDGTYIYVPASAFSSATLELFKITDTSYYSNSAVRYTWAYTQPLGYIAFQGGGLSSALTIGADHLTNYDGWYAYWPGAWGLVNSAVTFVRGAICEVEDYPSTVSLPTISAPELESGGSAQASFAVTLSCESTATSGTASSSSSPVVAMGFLVNNATAVTQAQTLGLTSGTNGLTTLLDSNYGASGAASGVGIKIYSDLSGDAINLLSTTYTAGAGSGYTGNTNGWYGYQDLTQSSGTDSSGNALWTGNFTASLEKISGETVTAGTVNAQLQVLVSLQ